MEEKNFQAISDQIANLKNDVNNQNAISKSLVNDSLQAKVNNINKRARMAIGGAVACVPVFVWLHFTALISWPVIISAIIMLLGSAVSTYAIHRKTMSSDFLSNTAAEVSMSLDKMKRQYANWTYYSLPVVFAWMVWYTYDFVTSMGFQGTMLAFTIFFCIICGIIGAFTGISRTKKTIHECDSAISLLSNIAR